MKLEDEINKFAHDVEEKFQEVKEHMILSVEKYSLVIALVLMSITAAILVIGTVYVWCFHHPGQVDEDEPEQVKQSESKQNSKSPSRIPSRQNSSQNSPLSEVKRQNSSSSEFKRQDSSQSEFNRQDSSQCESSPNEFKRQDSRGEEVRRRVPSTSNSINNNESPVKSKIPVRSAKVVKQS